MATIEDMRRELTKAHEDRYYDQAQINELSRKLIRRLKSEIKNTPNDAELHFALGNAYYGMYTARSLTSAIRCFDRVIELAPERHDAHELKGHSLLWRYRKKHGNGVSAHSPGDAGQLAEIIACFEAANANAAQEGEQDTLLAELGQELGQVHQAQRVHSLAADASASTDLVSKLAHLDAAIEAADEYDGGFLLLDKGDALLEHERWSEALDVYTTAVETLPDLAVGRIGALHLARFERGGAKSDLDIARKKLQQSLDDDGNNQTVWLAMVRACAVGGDIKGAVSALEKAMRKKCDYFRIVEGSAQLGPWLEQTPATRALLDDPTVKTLLAKRS